MEKQEYIVQIQDSLIAEFLYYWIQYGKPCLLLMRRPKTDGLTAIQLTAETPETYQFLETAIQHTGCKLWKKYHQLNNKKNESKRIQNPVPGRDTCD